MNQQFVTKGLELPGIPSCPFARSRSRLNGSVEIRGRIFFGVLQTLFGGNISIYAELCERARDDAFKSMLEHADRLGANGIIGVRYDANEIMSGVTEVLCYGRAVNVTQSP